MKTKLEIIEETVAYYSEDPIRRRAIDRGVCEYFVPRNNNSCAVGRCLKNPDKFIGNCNKAMILFQNEKKGFGVLKDEYKIENLDFWQDIQNLHDLDHYWTHNGLSTDGEYYVAQLKRFYKD